MWLGDSRAEIGGTSHCAADAAGASFQCADPEGGESFGGNIGTNDDELTLDVVPCPSGAECRATYQRDATLTCGR
jgi:hypothetical protein